MEVMALTGVEFAKQVYNVNALSVHIRAKARKLLTFVFIDKFEQVIYCLLYKQMIHSKKY